MLRFLRILVERPVAALTLVGALSVGADASRVGPPAPGIPPAAEGPFGAAPCPAGKFPDGDVCVRLATDEDDEAPTALSAQNAHRDRQGRWAVYDQIPRRPDRPADYDAYRFPVPCERGCVTSGYDLDRPDESQRRGRRPGQASVGAVGHGAVDLPQARGTPVGMVGLDHQQGDAEVVYVGALFGTTVITRHTVRESGKLRDYLLLLGHLAAPATGLAVGSRVKDGEPIGWVGDTGSPGIVHLHLETRRVRDGVDLAKLSPAAMVANETSVVCDPRNVLPLRYAEK